MILNIDNTTYQVIKTGYGNWDIVRMSDNAKIHTTDSQLIDGLDDENTDEVCERNTKKLIELFDNYGIVQ